MLPYLLDENAGSTESSMGTIQSTMSIHVCTCCKQCLAQKLDAQKSHDPQNLKKEFQEHSLLNHAALPAAHKPDSPRHDAMHAHSPLQVIHLPDSFISDQAKELQYQYHQNKQSTHTDEDLSAQYKNTAPHTPPNYSEALYTLPNYNEAMHTPPNYKQTLPSNYSDALYTLPSYNEAMHTPPNYKQALYTPPNYKQALYTYPNNDNPPKTTTSTSSPSTIFYRDEPGSSSFTHNFLSLL